MAKPTAEQCVQSSNTESSQLVSPLKRYVKILHKAAALKMIIDQALIQNNQSVQKPSQTTAKHGSTTSDLPLSPILSASHAPTILAVDSPLTVHQLNHQTVLAHRAEQSGSVERGDTLRFKEESGDTEVDIGPTKLQHMDSHYRTNQSLLPTSPGVDGKQSAQPISTPASAGDVNVASGGLPPNGFIKVDHKNLAFGPAVLDLQDTQDRSFVNQESAIENNNVNATSCSGVKQKSNKIDLTVLNGQRCAQATSTLAGAGIVKHGIQFTVEGTNLVITPSVLLHGDSCHGNNQPNTSAVGTKNPMIYDDFPPTLSNGGEEQDCEDSPIVYKCGYCLKTCACKITLDKHLRNVHGVRRLITFDLSIHRCSKCRTNFISEAFLDRHIKLKHSKEKSADLPHVNRCGYCKKVYFVKKYLDAHLNTVHGIFHTCSECKMKFISEASLKQHMKVHLKKDSPAVNQCGYCRSIYPSDTSLNDHLRKVHAVSFHRCSQCKASFIREAFLDRHIKLKHSKGKYEDNYRPQEDLENNLHCTESSESTHPPVDEVNAEASTQQQEVIVMKEEPGDEELELGPVLFQHMDCNYQRYEAVPLFDGYS